MEQVCRALNERMSSVLRRTRGTSEREHSQTTIEYHQTRNATARRSRVRWQKRKLKMLLAL